MGGRNVVGLLVLLFALRQVGGDESHRDNPEYATSPVHRSSGTRTPVCELTGPASSAVKSELSRREVGCVQPKGCVRGTSDLPNSKWPATGYVADRAVAGTDVATHA
jgi:hypothetical protein